jgi:hypothetical protein
VQLLSTWLAFRFHSPGAVAEGVVNVYAVVALRGFISDRSIPAIPATLGEPRQVTDRKGRVGLL